MTIQRVRYWKMPLARAIAIKQAGVLQKRLGSEALVEVIDGAAEDDGEADPDHVVTETQTAPIANVLRYF